MCRIPSTTYCVAKLGGNFRASARVSGFLKQQHGGSTLPVDSFMSVTMGDPCGGRAMRHLLAQCHQDCTAQASSSLAPDGCLASDAQPCCDGGEGERVSHVLNVNGVLGSGPLGMFHLRKGKLDTDPYNAQRILQSVTRSPTIQRASSTDKLTRYHFNRTSTKLHLNHAFH